MASYFTNLVKFQTIDENALFISKTKLDTPHLQGGGVGGQGGHFRQYDWVLYFFYWPPPGMSE